MSCCGGSCSCGKKDASAAEKSKSLVQMTEVAPGLLVSNLAKGLDHLSIEVELVEVRFKNGRTGIYIKGAGLELARDDRVLVESDEGYDVGTVSLSGERAQKKYGPENKDKSRLQRVRGKANLTDLENWLKMKSKEYMVLREARKIARDSGGEPGIKDVEFRGDGQKLTIYYTAGESFNAADLAVKYQALFGVKVEMIQLVAKLPLVAALD